NTSCILDTDGTLACSSDINLKKNIKTLEEIDFILNEEIEVPETILEKINTLTPITFNWNSEEDTDTTHLGFIAQEVEQVFPDLVTTSPDTDYKAIAYTKFIPYTIKALQELNLKVEGIASLDTENENSTFLVNLKEWIEGITFKKVKTEELCLDDVCITKNELQAILDGRNNSPIGNVPSDPVIEDPIEEEETTEPEENPVEEEPEEELTETEETPVEEEPEEETTEQEENPVEEEPPVEEVSVEPVEIIEPEVSVEE
ncbi:MAG: tail fiber domain-containing protein, partial [Patescibacteria group bacterium]|nr:tail fiber domain-containing protein [Patescibacteria group bacterium]